MALTLIVVATFRTSAHIGLAYGLAVNCDFILTTAFLTLVCAPPRVYNSRVYLYIYAQRGNALTLCLPNEILSVYLKLLHNLRLGMGG